MATEDTREKLLDTAEVLFGQHGFARVSVRQITREAGANVASVNYHFGSREGLLKAVFERRILPLNDERIRLLDAEEAAAGAGPLPLEALLRVFVAPTFRMTREHPAFMRFMGRMHLEPLQLESIFLRTGRFPELIERLKTATLKALPDVSIGELWWGWSFMVGGLIHTWTKGMEIEALSGGEATYESDETVSNRLVRFAAAGLRALAEQGGGE